MRIVSWNVNGLRACAKKGFLDVLTSSQTDVMLLQEVRAAADIVVTDSEGSEETAAGE